MTKSWRNSWGSTYKRTRRVDPTVANAPAFDVYIIPMPTRSYEEIRRAAIELLSKREVSQFLDPAQQQYGLLMTAVADVFRKWAGEQLANRHVRPQLQGEDRETFREVFWDLFRDGIITLGLNDSNREFPFFSVSRLGERILSQHSTYFFHDVASYEKIIIENVPNIDAATLTYLKEAMQAFSAGCVLASTIVLGVAAEHTFLLVLEAAQNNAAYGSFFATAGKRQWVSQKLDEFQKAIEQKMGTHLDPKVSHGIGAMFNNLQELIRDFRNKCGHPTGTVLSRDMAFVLLRLFIPYCAKAYELKAFFEAT